MFLAATTWFAVPASALAETVTRTSSFDYDAVTGLLTKETIEPDTPDLCVTTTYTYDAYGNKTGATTSNCSGAGSEAQFSSRTSAAWLCSGEN